MALRSESSKKAVIQEKRFWTPVRVVLSGIAGTVVLAIGLSSCASNEKGNPTVTSKPVVTSNPPTISRPAITGPVELSAEIRDTQVKTLDGESLKLSDYDNKVVVVNIWATWCGPCRQEMPDLVKLNNEYKSRGLVVLGLATTYNERNDPEHVKEFIKAQKVDYKILWDDGSLAGPLVQSMNGRGVIPQSFVIARDGRIVKHFTGFSPLSTPTLMRQAVEEALNDKGKA